MMRLYNVRGSGILSHQFRLPPLPQMVYNRTSYYGKETETEHEHEHETSYMNHTGTIQKP